MTPQAITDPQIKTRTITSLDPVESLGSGAFCLDDIPSLAIGPEFLRLGSDEDHPVCLPSFPPTQKSPYLKNAVVTYQKA